MKNTADVVRGFIGNTYSDLGMIDAEMEALGFQREVTDDEPVIQMEDGTCPALSYSDGKVRFLIGYKRGSAYEVVDVRRVSRLEAGQTKVDPFHSYEDLEAILKCFWNKGQYHHWLTACLMTGLGRRVGDTMSLKWNDIINSDGSPVRRLSALKEEKTGKVVAPWMTGWMMNRIHEFCAVTGINPSDHMEEPIFEGQPAAFRKQLKVAADTVGLDYPVSTHSFRKYFGNTIFKLHQTEGISMEVLRNIFGHDSVDTTRVYIGEMDNVVRRYMNEFSDYLTNKRNGIETEINGSPVIPIHADEFRALLSAAFEAGRNGEDKYDALTALEKRAESIVK